MRAEPVPVHFMTGFAVLDYFVISEKNWPWSRQAIVSMKFYAKESRISGIFQPPS